MANWRYLTTKDGLCGIVMISLLLVGIAVIVAHGIIYEEWDHGYFIVDGILIIPFLLGMTLSIMDHGCTKRYCSCIGSVGDLALGGTFFMILGIVMTVRETNRIYLMINGICIILVGAVYVIECAVTWKRGNEMEDEDDLG